MEIIKELNKDDGLEFIKNGSITHAMNVVVSKDGNSIQNEKSLETIIELDESIKIVGIIPCATELIIFCDTNNIYRYDEETKENKLVPNSWKWCGGEVFGTYTYNVRGDLIVAVSERNAKEDVPLKIINLNNADLGSDNIFTLNPHIPETEVITSGTEIGGKMRTGTYLLFIRFEISDKEYTSWKDLGVVIYLSGNATQHLISSMTAQGYKGNTKDLAVTYDLKDYAREETDYISYSIYTDLSFNNRTNNKFKSFQIAYICTYKGGTEAYNLGDYYFNDSNKYHVSGNRTNLEQLSVDEVLISANNFNLYNVKTMCNYNNRLYVANYKEEIKKLDISKINLSRIRIGIYQGKDDNDKELNTFKTPKPIEDEVYRFYLHYVYPDGSYTDGLLIENNNFRAFTSTDVEQKESVRITIGTYSIPKEGIYDRYIYMDCYDDTKVSDVKAAIAAAKADTKKYPNYSDILIKDKLGLIEMSERLKVDYYWFNLDPRFKKFTGNDKVELLSVYTNNNGDRLFRTPHKIKGNFTFKGIPMYPEFVGYFISYEEIGSNSILICDGIVDQHSTYVSMNKNALNFQSLQTFPTQTQFYSDDIYILKKGGTANVFVDLGYIRFQTRDRDSGISTHADRYIATYCFQNSSNEYTRYNIDPYYNIKDSYNMACTATLKSDASGQYFNLTFSNKGRKLVDTMVEVQPDGVAYKHTTIGRLLYINQEIYIKKQGVKLIRLGPTIYQQYEADNISYSYGDNSRKYNNFGYIDLSRIFMFDGRGVKFSGEWCPRVDYEGDKGDKYYELFQEQSGVTSSSRDVMHVNAVCYYKQITYFPEAKIIVNPIQDVYYSYRMGSPDNVKNIANKQLTAALLYNLFEISTIYVDYARPLINAYDEIALSNQIETYSKFIRRSNVIQSESTNNSWRQFPADGYKVISENKGDIINILGIGIYLIAHCEHSMFIFNRDSTLATKDKDVQMYMPDAFDTEYQEVFTSEKGYGGLQDYNAFTCNEVGYIFFDKSKRRLYRFDDKQLNDITDGIQTILDTYVDNNTIIDLGMDKELNRLVVSFTGEDATITLSYSLITNSWISAHNYSAKYYNTKTGLYLINGIANNIIKAIKDIGNNNYLEYDEFTIPTDKNIFYLGDKETNCAVVDIIFNLEYETIKLLNFISYNLRNSNNINYSGDKILIFTNSCISTEWDITTDKRNIKDSTKPYYEQGKWNFNYFRSLINTVESIEPVDRITGHYKIDIDNGEGENKIVLGKRYSSRDSLINGKYIGIRFIIHETKAKVLLNSIECYINKYRN